MPKDLKHFYDFSTYRVDESERLLLRGDEVVPLTPKAFEMLLVLLESSGHVLSKDELMKRVWPDTIVEEANLSHNIYKLREALGESRNGEKYIETVPRRGYRFVAKVTKVHDHGADLVVEDHSRARIVIEEDDAAEKVIETAGASISPARALPSQIETRRSSITKPGVMIAAGVVLIGLVAGSIYFWRTRASRSTVNGAGLRSIAVLPFKPLVASERDESLELGMTEALITRLSSIHQISVPPTSAVRKYADPQQDPVAAGRELKVESVLDGNLQHVGDRLRLTLRLVRVEDGTTLWADKFDDSFTDIFAVQDAISNQVAGALAFRLSVDEKQLLAKRYTENPEAYRLYLLGRYFWNKFTPADDRKAAEYFKQAIAKDPGYALAYTGLADSWGAATGNNWIAPSEGYPQEKAAAMKALEIDDTLAEAHASLGAVLMFKDLDWAGAEKEYLRAIELNPRYLTTYELYSYLRSATGRVDAGIELAKRGSEIDPLSLSLSDDTAAAYYFAHRFDEAIKQYQKSIEIDPNHAYTYVGLGQVYDQKGKYDEAIAAYAKAISLSERTSNILGGLAHAYAASGRRPEAFKILSEMTQMSKEKYVSPYDLAVVYTGLGERDRALEQLKKAFQERSGWIMNLKVEALFDPLRTDPRCVALERSMNYPQ
jgi:DNA-binding winged helix-turn-helix (wHTH) protein/TolB-like protein